MNINNIQEERQYILSDYNTLLRKVVFYDDV